MLPYLKKESLEKDNFYQRRRDILFGFQLRSVKIDFVRDLVELSSILKEKGKLNIIGFT